MKNVKLLDGTVVTLDSEFDTLEFVAPAGKLWSTGTKTIGMTFCGSNTAADAVWLLEGLLPTLRQELLVDNRT